MITSKHANRNLYLGTAPQPNRTALDSAFESDLSGWRSADFTLAQGHSKPRWLVGPAAVGQQPSCFPH